MRSEKEKDLKKTYRVCVFKVAAIFLSRYGFSTLCCIIFSSGYGEGMAGFVWGMQLARAACMRCHRTKCPLLTAFLLLFLVPAGHWQSNTFLPEGVIVGF